MSKLIEDKCMWSSLYFPKLSELQGKLADLNLVIDKSSTDTTREDVDAETKELLSVNERRRAALEQAFEERRQREAQILQLEKEIQQASMVLM